MRSSRIPSLDGLRALAILLVCINHFHSAGALQQLGPMFGHCGVRIFLTLSGFLITSILLKERQRTGAISLKRFFVRRAYRILPAAYCYMIVVTIIYFSTLRPRQILTAFTFMASYDGHLPWVLGHLWSLSVEEQFYFLWPAALVLSLIFARRFAWYVVAASPLLRFAFYKFGFGMGAMFYLPSVADSLALGCLLAMNQHKLAKYRAFFAWRGFPIIWGLTLLTPAVLVYSTLIPRPFHQIVSVFGFTVFSFGIMLCIQNGIVAPPRILNLRVVVWVGTLSYSLYLWQEIFSNPATSWVTLFPQNLILTLLATLVSFYAIEQPFLKLRERRAAGLDGRLVRGRRGRPAVDFVEVKLETPVLMRNDS